MNQQIVLWLLSGLPLLGMLLTFALWSRLGWMKFLAVATAVITFVATVILSGPLTGDLPSLLLIYLLPIAACASILGQPVKPEHRSAWSITLLLLSIGMAALIHQGITGSFFKVATLVLLITLFFRYRNSFWPLSWQGVTVFFLGIVAIIAAVVMSSPLASIASLIACAVLLPLIPFHSGYVAAVNRLPGNLPSFIVVLLPVLGLHSLAEIVPELPDTVTSVIMSLALISAIYGAFKALTQSRVPLILAYGSLSFFSIMWWFAAATFTVTSNAQVFVGAVSLGTSGLLIAWQVIRTRYGDDVDPIAISGLVSTMPRYAVFLTLIALAVMGLPPFGVYTGFMALAFSSPIATSAAMFVILAAWLTSSWYILEAVQGLIFGQQRTVLRSADLFIFETTALLIVVLAILLLGVIPAEWLFPDQPNLAFSALIGELAWNQ